MAWGDVQIDWKPIVEWPRPFTTNRAWDNFKTTNPNSYGRKDIPVTKTINELHDELRRIDVKRAVVQLALKDRDIRIDGQVRADAKPSHPGVILSFEHPKQGPLSMACDKWDKWQANLRGIVKALEALRLVDRYGITSKGEQYAGYRELGAGIPMGPHEEPPMSKVDAARILAGAISIGEHELTKNTTLVLEDADFRKFAYRMAVKLAHPDAGAEDSEGFRRIQKARDVLGDDDA